MSESRGAVRNQKLMSLSKDTDSMCVALRAQISPKHVTVMCICVRVCVGMMSLSFVAGMCLISPRRRGWPATTRRYQVG